MHVVVQKIINRCRVTTTHRGWICENEEQLAKLIDDVFGHQTAPLELVEPPGWKEIN
jgi:hypothetical protein